MCKDKKNAPIAVIDSGVGGISVLSELLRIMPHESYIYFADSKNAPYGVKTRDEVLAIMLENTKILLGEGAKAIVVACNTATSAAVRVMREKYPSLPIVGIEPAIKPAALVCEHPTVVVMATPLTLKEEKFKNLMDRFASDEEIIPLACPGLMEIIESGQTDGEVVDAYVRDVFAPLGDKKIDAVVLGCTHYPFVKKTLEKFLGDNVVILDGAAGTAREAKRRIEAAGLLCESDDHRIEYLFTKENDDKEELCKRLLSQLK
ncbi:MAG: glutamate racemase [Ruminococcaceae bacterium]|nr:glutamate racemase [Oscillospiraceae bacterium]